MPDYKSMYIWQESTVEESWLIIPQLPLEILLKLLVKSKHGLLLKSVITIHPPALFAQEGMSLKTMEVKII